MLGPQLTIDERPHGEWVVLDLAGELDMATAPRLISAIEAHADDQVAVDLSDVTFIDSLGLRALINARQTLGDDRIRLVAPEGPVLRLLKLTKLDQTFSVSDALT